MAKQDLTIEITFNYDPALNDGKPAHIFLFQLLNKLNREIPITAVKYKTKTKTFADPETDLPKVALRKVDSVSDTDLPKKPKWLKDKTELKPGTNENVAKRIGEGKKIIRTK